MASTRFRVAGLTLVFIVSLLALERLCSANAHAHQASGGKVNGEEQELANCDVCFLFSQKLLIEPVS